MLCSSSLCYFLLSPTRRLLSFRCPASDRRGCWQRFDSRKLEKGEKTEMGEEEKEESLRSLETVPAMPLPRGKNNKAEPGQVQTRTA